MNKRQTIVRLKEIETILNNKSYTFIDRQSFRNFCLIYEHALLKTALNFNVDPDSVSFYYEIEDGNGTKWKSPSKKKGGSSE